MQKHDEQVLRDMVMRQGTLMKEIHRRLLIIERKVDSKPCAENGAKLKIQEILTLGLVSFSGTLLITLLVNIDKIKKAFS